MLEKKNALALLESKIEAEGIWRQFATVRGRLGVDQSAAVEDEVNVKFLTQPNGDSAFRGRRDSICSAV